ncbi:hypothetical protein BJ742DRAFT_856609 [Cladochytrium replicatum]|nr:hypothetical protein BJ742DRAFT_856609 [Cladochytrium replicatum]
MIAALRCPQSCVSDPTLLYIPCSKNSISADLTLLLLMASTTIFSDVIPPVRPEPAAPVRAPTRRRHLFLALSIAIFFLLPTTASALQTPFNRPPSSNLCTPRTCPSPTPVCIHHLSDAKPTCYERCKFEPVGSAWCSSSTEFMRCRFASTTTAVDGSGATQQTQQKNSLFASGPFGLGCANGQVCEDYINRGHRAVRCR